MTKKLLTLKTSPKIRDIVFFKQKKMGSTYSCI